MVYLLGLWGLIGIVFSYLYLFFWFTWGIPGQRSVFSIVWRAALCPVFWPFVFLFDLMHGSDL